MRRLRRLLFPPGRPTAGEAKDRGVLLIIALVLVLGAIREVLTYGPAQGCPIAFYGLGFGCQPWTPPPGYHVGEVNGYTFVIDEPD